MTLHNLKQIPIDEIDVEEGFNVRVMGHDTREKLSELGENIAKSGLQLTRPSLS